MRDLDAIEIARAFLSARGIGFEGPASAVASGQAIEVVFNTLGTTDPNQVVDPPDVRVLVSTLDGQCKLVEQM